MLSAHKAIYITIDLVFGFACEFTGNTRNALLYTHCTFTKSGVLQNHVIYHFLFRIVLKTLN